MPVNIPPLDSNALFPVPGVRIGVAEAGIRKANRKDVTLFELAGGSRVAGVFTLNRFCAAPVHVCQQHLSTNDGMRALVINTGCANAGTGEDGLTRAKKTCEAVAGLLGIQASEVLPFSTGVILEPLPVDRLIAGLPAAKADLSAAHWARAAQGIMTTDTVPKAASRRVTIGGATITITGISKGAGMIQPNMATMLGYLATDAKVSSACLKRLVKDAADASFNSITIDGDTSTNDSFILIATQQAAMKEITDAASAEYAQLAQAVTAVSIDLAQAIVRDGEGATKFIAINVEGGKSRDECRKVAKAIAHSPLVKTAMFASDPNLGRILAAIGYSGVDDLDVNTINVWLGDVLVAERGGRAASYTEEQGQRVMKPAEITIRVALGRGNASATIWTCDFSYDYVKINADYRS